MSRTYTEEEYRLNYDRGWQAGIEKAQEDCKNGAQPIQVLTMYQRQINNTTNNVLAYGEAVHKINTATFKLTGPLGEIMVAIIQAARLPTSQQADALKATVPVAKAILDLAADLRWAVRDYGPVVDQFMPGAFRRDGIDNLLRLSGAVADGLHALEKDNESGVLMNIESSPAKFRAALEAAKSNPVSIGRPRDPETAILRKLRDQFEATHGKGVKRALAIRDHLNNLDDPKPAEIEVAKFVNSYHDNRALAKYIKKIRE